MYQDNLNQKQLIIIIIQQTKYSGHTVVGWGGGVGLAGLDKGLTLNLFYTSLSNDQDVSSILLVTIRMIRKLKNIL